MSFLKNKITILYDSPQSSQDKDKEKDGKEDGAEKKDGEAMEVSGNLTETPLFMFPNRILDCKPCMVNSHPLPFLAFAKPITFFDGRKSWL